jgi:sec-independent protein translocase protein TatB
MLGLGVGEVVIILIVALVVLGPTKLPQVARQVGKGLREFRRAASDLQNTFDEVAREAEREERAAETKKLLNLGPPDGEPVSSVGFKQFFDPEGHPLQTDHEGHPLDAEGHRLPLDAAGNPIFKPPAAPHGEPGSASLGANAVASASGDVSPGIDPPETK